jgi:HSP20 family protein
MSMERWNPFRDFDNMRQAMDRWMDERLAGNRQSPAQANPLSVALDIHETQAGYELEASLPGVKPEDLDIQIDRETLTLRGKSAADEEKQAGRNFIYRERRSGSFFRTVRLPEAVDPEKVEATLENGVLRVQLPKLNQTGQRRVQVRPISKQAENLPSVNQIAATSSNEGGNPLKGTTEEQNHEQSEPKPDPDRAY